MAKNYSIRARTWKPKQLTGRMVVFVLKEDGFDPVEERAGVPVTELWKIRLQSNQIGVWESSANLSPVTRAQSARIMDAWKAYTASLGVLI